ncbi:DUF4340 domain-containing protein [uncultured Paraglaciecola sp.]|uniref:DUF4340 domain-containing protein n=1 Tax=uncultured Paraglaciecola sp. TaxID=1765024 RepID=UPI002603D30F|nr:DUF4340 domain-containing protein [uncultured Paraglaciecola sp.]
MNKFLATLLVMATVSVGLVVWLTQPSFKDNFETKLLFDDLQTLAHQVDSVEIANAQGIVFSAKRIGERWLGTFDIEQNVYPISRTKLASFVDTIMHAKLLEAKTRKPKNYRRLGLQPISNEDSMASFVTIKAGSHVWQVLVGNKVTNGQGQYVLIANDPQSWRIDKTIRLPIDKYSWLKQPILPYEPQNIASISRVDNNRWQIERSVSGDFQLLNKPKNKELAYQGILNSIVDSLTSVNFEKLLSVDESVIQSIKILTQLEVTTAEDQLFKLVVSEKDGQYFVNFSSDNQLEYWHMWHYQISHFSAQQLIKTLDDFLAKPNTASSDDTSQPDVVEEGDSPY